MTGESIQQETLVQVLSRLQVSGYSSRGSKESTFVQSKKVIKTGNIEYELCLQINISRKITICTCMTIQLKKSKRALLSIFYV